VQSVEQKVVEGTPAAVESETPAATWLRRVRENWTLIVGVGGVLLALQRFFTVLFYSRFGVSVDDVGIGSVEAVLTGVATVLVPYVGLNVVIFWLLSRSIRRSGAVARRSAQSVRAAFRTNRAATARYVVQRTTLVVLVIGTLGLGAWYDDRAIYVGAGLIALALWLLGPVDSPRTSSVSAQVRHVDRRADHRMIAALSTLFTLLFFVVTPLLHQAQDASAVKKGHRVAGFPIVPWSVEQAALTWIVDPPASADRLVGHCLMYLGTAGGTTVLYDVDTRRAVRVPTSNIVVETGSGSNPHCPEPS
jgi:hypothetical protein